MLVGCLILPYCGGGGTRYPLFVAVLKLGSGLNDFFVFFFYYYFLDCSYVLRPTPAKFWTNNEYFGFIWWILLLLSLDVMFESVCVCM